MKKKEKEKEKRENCQS